MQIAAFEVFPDYNVRWHDRKKSLLSNQEIYTVVQPDLCVVCNPEILDQQGCNGAPDWIVEILSKGNSKREVQLKYNLYQENFISTKIFAGFKSYRRSFFQNKAIY
jgi:Uma2 family endonuclease